jgi:hypothetical protein
VPIDWRHDPSKWGSPQQGWVTSDKAIWLLYVVSKEVNVSELNARVITNTFNKHFRQAGQLFVGNINRDLGKLKGRSPAVIAEDTIKDPPAWFLTDAGIKHAQGLIAQSIGQSNTLKL